MKIKSKHILWAITAFLGIALIMFTVTKYGGIVLLLTVIGIAIYYAVKNAKQIVKFFANHFTWKEEIEVKRDIVITKEVTYVLGIALCALFTTPLALWITSLLPLVAYFIPCFIIIFALLIAQIFVGGFVQIGVGYHAVILFLGQPVPGPWVLATGWNWIWKPFFKIELVSISEQILDVPLTAGEEGIRVTTLARSAGDTDTGGQMDLLVRLAVRYRIFSSKQFIIFDEGGGGKKTRDGIRNLAHSSIRTQAAGMTDEAFIKDKDIVATKVQQDIDMISNKEWGIDIVGCPISKAQIAEEGSRKIRESETNEKRQRAAEIIELDHVGKRIRNMADDLVVAGYLPEEAAKEAAKTVARERGKATQFYFDGDAGDFTKGAAVSSTPTKT